MKLSKWEPDNLEGSGVYQTLHDPPRWMVYYVYPSGGTMRSKAYLTREEAQEDLERHIKQSEDFWAEKIAWKEAGDVLPDGRAVVRANGEHYVVGPVVRYTDGAGFGGRHFTIRMHDGRVIETRNLWSQGRIPDEYRDQLPDNAEFFGGF